MMLLNRRIDVEKGNLLCRGLPLFLIAEVVGLSAQMQSLSLTPEVPNAHTIPVLVKTLEIAEKFTG